MKHEKVGANIREYRKMRKLTQQELADRIGVTWEMVSRYERGKSSSANSLEKISDALGIKSEDLLKENTSTPNAIPLLNNPSEFISISELIPNGLDISIIYSKSIRNAQEDIIYITSSNLDTGKYLQYIVKDTRGYSLQKELSNKCVAGIVGYIKMERG